MANKENIILLTDSYKVGHWPQYQPGTTNVYSYFESRGGLFPATVFFGLQYLLKKYLCPPVTLADLDEAKAVYAAHFESDKLLNYDGWEKLIWRYRGALPVRIKAVPEGTLVPTSNVLMTVENTDPDFPWLTNYLETLLSQVWYPTTVATISYFVRQKILQYLEETGDPAGADFKLHDFGFRGVSSVESAGIGGAAHLTSFLGTDTVHALTTLRRYYGADMAGFSVPAAEHSTITSWGKTGELDAYRNMIEKYGDFPIYSVVSDSFDIYAVCRDMFGGALKDEVLSANGTLVVRPDSGDPPKVVVDLLDILGEKFGCEWNAKGYKVLNPKVRMIWGDGLDPKMIESILFRMKLKNWSADNITFGMGGGLLQKVNRDTQKFAFKCSSVVVDGQQRNVFKQPVTDPGKNSKRGRLSLVHGDISGWQTVIGGDQLDDKMVVVYENGRLERDWTLDEVRQRTGLTQAVLV